MGNTLFEQMGGTYEMQGDYELPRLSLPPEEENQVGIFGQRYRRHLKANHRILYYNLLTSGKLNGQIAEIDRQANAMFDRLVKALSEKENVNEKLKSTDSMAWVQRMNGIRNRATEVVNAELIFV